MSLRHLKSKADKQYAEYADDMQFITKTSQSADVIIEKIKTIGPDLGFSLNESKTEQFELSYENRKDRMQIVYLGATIGNTTRAVKNRISKARAVYSQLYSKLFSINIDVKYKIRVFERDSINQHSAKKTEHICFQNICLATNLMSISVIRTLKIDFAILELGTIGLN